MNTKEGLYQTPYSKKLIIKYLQSIAKIINKSPTYRDLNSIPGPSPRTIIRHFGTWANALKNAKLRPHTNQLMKGERTYIRKNWKKMSDKQLSNQLDISIEVIKYYRSKFNLWKNRKGTSKQGQKSKAIKLYGEKCEVCNLAVIELHHIVPRSNNLDDWCILCPLCHSLITNKKIKIENRSDLKKKLKPVVANIYKDLSIR